MSAETRSLPSHRAERAPAVVAAIGAIAAVTAVAAQGGLILAVGALAGFLFVARVWSRPLGSACLVVVVVYSNATEVVAGHYGISTLIEPLLVLVLAGVAVSLLRDLDLGHRQSGAAAQTFVLIAGYWAVLLAGLFWADDSSRAFSSLVGTSTNMMIALIVIAAIRSHNDLRAILIAILVTGLAMSLIGIHQYITSSYGNNYGGFGQASVEQIVTGFDDWRISGPYADPNFYSQATLVTVAIGLGRFIGDPARWVRILGIAAAGTAALAVVLSFSRGGMLGLIAVLLLAAFFHRPQPSMLAGVGLVMLALAAAIPASYQQRVTTLTSAVPGIAAEDEVGDVSVRGRTSEVIAGLQMFRDNPLLGVGPGNYPARYQEYSRALGIDPRREDREAHSYYVEIAAETGAVGLFFFGTLLVGVAASLRRALRSEHGERRRSAKDLSIALGGYSVTSLFLHSEYDRLLWLLFALAVAASVPWADRTSGNPASVMNQS